MVAASREGREIMQPVKEVKLTLFSLVMLSFFIKILKKMIKIQLRMDCCSISVIS